MPDIERLMYASAAVKPFSAGDLTDLLTKARLRNAEVDVTGMLIYKNGSFLQILEGEPGAAQAVLDRISRDPRHHKILLLLRETARDRNFGDWRMGFVNLDRKSMPPGFVDFFGAGESFLDLKGDANRVLTFMRGFRDGKWRRHVEEA